MNASPRNVTPLRGSTGVVSLAVPRRWFAHIALALVAMLGIATLAGTSSARAADPANRCSYGTGGVDASGLCWLDLSGYEDAAALSATGQEFTETIPGGYTLSFTLKRTATAGSPAVAAVAVPEFSGAPLGNPKSGQYVGIAGKPGLYAQGTFSAPNNAGTWAATLSNLKVVNSAGEVMTGWTLSAADAETTNVSERLKFSSGGEGWQLLNSMPSPNSPPTAACGEGLVGVGTATVTCAGGKGANVGAVVLAASGGPSQVAVATEQNYNNIAGGGGQSGFAFAIGTANITLNKSIASRAASTDEFTTTATDQNGTQVGAATTTGTNTSSSTGSMTVLPGSPYSLSEVAAGTTNLDNYRKAWSCSNATSGSTTTLPSGTSLPVSVTPAAGDDITCALTNTAILADLSIVKTATPATAVPGEDETYTLVVKNNGPDPAVEAVASDPLPPELSFVSAEGCSFASGTVTCAAGTLAPGASKSFKVVTKVARSVTHRIDNTATVTSKTADPEPKNNESTVEVPVGPKADLAIIKTASTGSVAPGGQVMYTLVIKNNGPSDATGVTVDDSLPAGITLVSAIPSQGSCSGTKCSLGLIADGGSAQILMTAEVLKSVAGNIKNTATVKGDQPDPKPENNESTTTINVPNPPPPAQPVSDLKIVKKVNRAKVYPGQKLTYTLTVSNLGPDTATEVNVTDTPSLSLKVFSANPSQGSCKVGRPLTCALGTLADGRKVTIKVVAEVMDVGTESNAASVTSGSRDPNPENNLDSARTKVVPVLRLKKTGRPSTVKAGGEVTYHLKVTNPMSIALHDVKVCDSLPSGLAYVSSSPKAKLTAGRTCWTLKSLARRSSKTITVIARALRGASGKLTNQATASAKGVKRVAARAAVDVIAAPPRPTPVTG